MGDFARMIREREMAFEAQYKLDEEQNFKIRARRDRLFATWVAKIIGLDQRAAEQYAIHAAQLDLEVAGDQNLLDQVKADLSEAGRHLSDDDLVHALSNAQVVAQRSYGNQFPTALDNDHHV